ncbi:MAG TPA: LacI family DNA-binding transcriptional regulator [Anaerolineaceae bacterium]|nr:LacI family DNA-binding transcriptional regulator [Anaerolineaceae bacterium]
MPKQITLKDVAKQANVSFQTVSKVLNKKARVTPETEKRIYDAIQTLDYHPNFTARSLRVQKTRTIGYSWRPAQPGRYNPILDEFLQGMFHAAETFGYNFLCFPYSLDPQKRVANYKTLIQTRRLDGFVLSTVNYEEPGIKFLLDNRVPFYAFGRASKDQSFPYIDVDGGAGLQSAVDHLVEQGHKSIAALAWPPDSRVGNDRMQGYFTQIQKHNLPVDDKLVLRGEGTAAVGYAGLERLLELPANIRPTAVVTMNDEMAFGVMAKLRDLALIPGKDFGVVGFDDVPAARLSRPSLSSVHQPADRIGKLILERLINWLETGKYPDPVAELISPELMIRESSLR